MHTHLCPAGSIDAEDAQGDDEAAHQKEDKLRYAMDAASSSTKAYAHHRPRAGRARHDVAVGKHVDDKGGEDTSGQTRRGPA